MNTKNNIENFKGHEVLTINFFLQVGQESMCFNLLSSAQKETRFSKIVNIEENEFKPKRRKKISFCNSYSKLVTRAVPEGVSESCTNENQT